MNDWAVKNSVFRNVIPHSMVEDETKVERLSELVGQEMFTKKLHRSKKQSNIYCDCRMLTRGRRIVVTFRRYFTFYL
jgi:hypothetical protein